MKEIFPPSIYENNNQSFFVRSNKKTKIIYWIIIVFFIIIFILLPFIYVDVTTQSTGYIRSVHNNNAITSPIQGKILKIDLYDNKYVNIGDTLIYIDSYNLDHQIHLKKKVYKENLMFLDDLFNLMHDNNNIQSRKYQNQRDEYLLRLKAQMLQLQQTEKEYNLSKILYEKKLESLFNYNQIMTKYNIEKSNYQNIIENQKKSWNEDYLNITRENLNLYIEVEHLESEKDQYFIKAPARGNIVNYNNTLMTGNYVYVGQEIAQISTVDSLLIENYVSPQDIGFIFRGQPVKVLIDAFDYQQWGMLSGSVEEIITDAVYINNEPFFRVKCILDKNYLELPNGYRGYLKKGMTGTTRFFLQKRSLMQLILDNINDWTNPKIKK